MKKDVDIRVQIGGSGVTPVTLADIEQVCAEARSLGADDDTIVEGHRKNDQTIWLRVSIGEPEKPTRRGRK